MVKKLSPKNNLQIQVDELENKYKRALADYQNQERRHQQSKDEIVRYSNGVLLEKMLLVLDSLELAQSHLQDKGLQLVLDQFNKVLAEEKVSLIPTDSQEFNPETMDCVEVVTGKKNQVVKTISKGYMFFDKVLRPARVQVGDGR